MENTTKDHFTSGTISIQIERALYSVDTYLKISNKSENKLSPLLSPEFNVFDYINTTENKISQIIADLLNPGGKHGQKQAFLDCFLLLVGFEDWIPSPADVVEVRTEARTDRISQGTRRLDIIVRWPGHALAIENKLDARDQEGQLRDYLFQLEGLKQENFCIIYLTKDGKVPTGISLPEEEQEARFNSGQLKLMAYQEIATWISRCKEVSRSAIISSFLSQFEKYVQKEYAGIEDMEKIHELTQFIINENLLVPALQISKVQDQLKRAVLRMLENQVLQLISSNSLTWKTILNEDPGWATLSIQLEQGDRHAITVETDSTGWTRTAFGIKRIASMVEGEPDDRLPDVWEHLNKYLRPGKRHIIWPWYVHVNQLDDLLSIEGDWGTNDQPWVSIASGDPTIAKKIVEAVAKICDALRDANLLERLR